MPAFHAEPVIDIVGSLALNWFATGKAAQSPTLRWNVWGDKDTPWTDGRFIGGALAAALPILGIGSATVQRVGQVAATGALNSFVATEAIRSAAVARAGAQPPAMQQQSQQQLPGGAPGLRMPGGLSAMVSQFAPGMFR